MNKDKWEEVVREAADKLSDRTAEGPTPESWPEVKKEILEFVEEVDQATEVYNAEKGVPNGKQS